MSRTCQLKWKQFLLPILCTGLIAAVGAAEHRSSIPHGTVELLSEQESIQPGRAIHLGLHFQLEQGWHVYWINPGDSGEPPRLEWHLPAGLKAGAIEWPAPSRLPIPPLLDYGYERDVLLPIAIESTSGLAAGSDVTLAAEMKAIVCREVCIPAKAQLALSLPVRAEPPGESAATKPMFAVARKALPKPAPASWKPSARDLGDSFELSVHTGQAEPGAWFAPLEPEQIENAAPQKNLTAAASVRLMLKKSDQLLKPISRLRGLLILSGGAYMIDAPVAAPPAHRPKKEQ